MTIMATAILPAFVVALVGWATLGLIEGLADASTSGMKIFAGWYSDYTGKRKPFANIGYFLTAIGVGSLALAVSWPFVLLSRVVAWLGRGVKNPPRDALLVESTRPEYHGRVFGFHRAMDTLVVGRGPAIALVLVRGLAPRPIFAIAFIPSILAFVTVALLVKEIRKGGGERTNFFISVKNLPRNFRFFLIAVGTFGLGNFADSLLILRSTELLAPVNGAVVAVSLAILLYTIHNVFYAAISFPVGVLADKIGKKTLLAFGYLLTGIAVIGFIFNIDNMVYLGIFFAGRNSYRHHRCA